MYNNKVEYEKNVDKDLYLHILSTDKVGNELKLVKKYELPNAIEIECENDFVNKKPTYKIKDKNKQEKDVYMYQVRYNNGEWINVNADTECTLENANIGRNIIEARKIDIFGRTSEIDKKTVTYNEKENNVNSTILPTILPNTGKIEYILLAIISLVSIAVVFKFKYKKYKDI